MTEVHTIITNSTNKAVIRGTESPNDILTSSATVAMKGENDPLEVDILLQRMEGLLPMSTSVQLQQFNKHVRALSHYKSWSYPKINYDFMSVFFLSSDDSDLIGVAQFLAELLHVNNILSLSQLFTVTVDDIISVYDGQTGLKTQKKINEAMGGVLLISDAHRLAEALDAEISIAKLLTASYTGEIVVFFAGEMEGIHEVLSAHQGLACRTRYFLEM